MLTKSPSLTLKSNTFSEKLTDILSGIEVKTIHFDELRQFSPTKTKKRTKSIDRFSSSNRNSVNIEL